MKKLLLMVLFLIIWVNGVIALSIAREHFIVYNLSGKDIIINFEPPVKPTEVGLWQYYILDIAGVPVVVHDPLFGHTVLASNRKIGCVDYLPDTMLLDDNDYYEKLGAIPILDKLNAIFKSFTITDLEGNVLVTLPDIKEEDIIKEQISPGSLSLNYVYVITEQR
jgi:hypothetical protein